MFGWLHVRTPASVLDAETLILHKDLTLQNQLLSLQKATHLDRGVRRLVDGPHTVEGHLCLLVKPLPLRGFVVVIRVHSDLLAAEVHCQYVITALNL